MDEKTLSKKKVADLRVIASTVGLENANKLKKAELIEAILSGLTEKEQKTSNIKQEKPVKIVQAENSDMKNTMRRVGKPAEKRVERPVNSQARPYQSPEERQPKKYSKTDARIEPSRGSKPEGYIKKEHHNKNENPHHTQNEGHQNEAPTPVEKMRVVEGILELAENGFGFLRFDNFMSSEADIYVSPVIVKKYKLKTGDKLKGRVKEAKSGDKFGSLAMPELINGDEPSTVIGRRNFENLTPIFPTERFVLGKSSRQLAMRLIDLVAPIGKGQRGIIVAPPKAGKTTLLKEIANRIEEDHPEVELIILLIDERPEEVTDIKRSLRGDGEVIYSTFDELPQNHVKVAEMVMSRAQRLAEQGKDVVILLDSITRLARAYNLVLPSSGRTLSGGFDPGALHKPKKFFGTARNIEEGGSVTILATALVETGSRMDEVIFEEFKGTGNMELHLDRKLSEKRVFPAINLNKSGTRKENLLMSKEEQEAVWYMRRSLGDESNQDAVETIISHLAHTASNEEFIRILPKIKL